MTGSGETVKSFRSHATATRYPGEVRRFTQNGHEFLILYSGNRFRLYRMGDGDTRFPDGRMGDQIGTPHSYLQDATDAAQNYK